MCVCKQELLTLKGKKTVEGKERGGCELDMRGLEGNLEWKTFDGAGFINIHLGGRTEQGPLMPLLALTQFGTQS